MPKIEVAMSNQLEFSVRLQMMTDAFNRNVREAGDRFSQMTRSIEQNVARMNQDTERASDLLGRLGRTDTNVLTSEIEQAANELRRMGAGARLSQEQIDAAMRQSATHVARLAQQLDVARQEAERLGRADASPDDIERATQEISRLERELQRAERASTQLSDEMARAMNRAADTSDNARNAIYRMANIRLPDTITNQINQMRRALTEFQRNSGAPAEEIARVTRITEEQIRRLEQELRGLDDQIDRTTDGTQRFSGGIGGVRNAIGSLQGMLAAVGLGIGANEIIEMSDAFKTLEARIKLATGEGINFQTGFDGVKRIADETFSSVENTGELFARITQAAETLGLAQSEVLGVTQTINQAIKLSGGSAASADAAITQLIQGLQSGVVRGEEFNSIMEQAPRLAQAMANGLGVTRGELRALAQDGQLTSEVVIKAVQSQAQTIAEEFGTLPTTVGNSLMRLKNQMFEFVGEMDKSVNQSSKLAEAINLITDSLGDLDPATVAAVNEAFNQMMTTVGGLWRVITTYYEQLNGWINTLTNNTDAANEQVGFITRTMQGVTIVMGAINDGIKAIEIAMHAVTGVSSLFLSTLTEGLSKLTFGEVSKGLADFAERLKTQSTESFGKAEEAALSFESSTKQAFDNAAQTAQDRLNATADTATQAYLAIATDGTSSAEAIQGAFIEMATAQIAAYGDANLAALQAEAAQRGLKLEINEAGKAVVEAMTNAELVTNNAALATEKATDSANKLAESVGVGLSKGYQEAKASVLALSDDFKVLSDAGYDAGEVMVAALTDMVKKAKNADEIKDVIAMWEELGEQGKLTGEDLAAGLDLANERLDALTDGVNSVNEAYKILGLTTRQEAAKQAEAYTQAYSMIVKDGEATAGQLTEAFKKTAKAQIAANGDVISATLKTQAAQRGLKIEIDETGRVSFVALDKVKKATDAIRPPIDRARDSMNGLGTSANSAGNSMVKAAERAYQSYDKLESKVRSLQSAQKEVEAANNQLRYGKDTAPTEGNQFGSRADVENFLKQSGLSEEQAREQTRKLYSKAGQNDGALDFAKLQGFQEGQKLSTNDLNNFKSASQYLADIAEKSRNSKTSSYGAKSSSSSTNVLDTYAQQSVPMHADPNSSNMSLRVVNADIKITLNGYKATSNVEQSALELIKELEESKAISGY